MSKKQTPVELCIAKFGGVRRVAAAINVDHSYVVRLRQRDGGLWPAKYQPRLLDAAKERGIKLTAIELIQGAKA